MRSSATTVVNGRVGYRWDNGWRVQLDGLNLFNAKANQIEYFYEFAVARRGWRAVASTATSIRSSRWRCG